MGDVRSRVVWLWAGVAVFALLTCFAWPKVTGYDAHAYWAAWHRPDMYGGSPNTRDAFLYSPVFAQAVWPLAQLPWAAFLTIWILGGAALYGWLLWPLPWRLRAPLLALCVPQALVGNVWPLLALVVVVGFRRPAWWAVPLLLKVTAATGFVWFAVRREWRALTVAATAATWIALVSIVISPGLWVDWLRLLVDGGSGGTPAGAYAIPLTPRLAAALVLVVYGALSGRRWLLAFSVGLASPVFAASWLASNLFVLAALPRLEREISAEAPGRVTATAVHTT